MNFTQTVRLLSKYEENVVLLLLVPNGTSIPAMETNQTVRMYGFLRYVDFDTWEVRGTLEDPQVLTYYARFKATDVITLDEKTDQLNIVATWGHEEVVVFSGKREE